MPRIDVNRSGEMEALVRVVERGGFSAAARELRMTPSAISKLVSRLEARLGARLFHRSTRKLQLTPEGRAFYERSTRILGDIDEAERGAALGAEPRGRVSVNCSVPFGLLLLAPLLPAFLERHPLVCIDLTLEDAVIDFHDKPADVAIRHGELPASELVARHLGDSRKVVVAAPAYLDRHGTPRNLKQLEKHNRLGFNFPHSTESWPFRHSNGTLTQLPVGGNARTGDGESLRLMVVAGAGIARLSRYHVQPDIDAGRLAVLLEGCNPGDIEPLHAVYRGRSGHQPARVRVFLDFLVERIRLS
ncbi:MAG: LysR family transcriptional regulator [Hydrocarboniphaga sp.]|uniref:LysR family transcriptional regulator n=1 Tax=Hydrocarboniphaga sp. TaxID=2033016 RepID=UPI00260E5553|nr:LysR family transcriptional regulator [Hydrocarboniphaga sp.]MDB5973136.1 LysR family transcriptional regulator [Hydrocarboniphaga sp.]